jgi:CRISPR-associated protein Cas4
LFSVSDLRAYSFCKRSLWLSRKAKIKAGEKDWDFIKYRVLRSITTIVDSNQIQSLTHLLLKTLNKTDGKMVKTEIELEREGLSGRIDVLWKVDNGYIIQEEKTGEPPKDKIAWEEDLLQLDAYAFLAEGTEYSPVVDGIIIYNDLKPRKIKLNPDNAVEVLREAIWLLENDSLPEEKGNKTICKKCSYYALCQILPKEGKLTATEIRNAFATQLTGIIQRQ